MANTIAGANLAAIAEETLPHLATVFAPLQGIITDMSMDIAAKGESVTTRVPTVPTAKDLSSGYSVSDVTLASKTITLNTFYGFVWGFTDVERSKSVINLNDTFISPAVTALGTKVFGDIWNLATTTFAATSIIVTAANFDRSDLADIGATLTATKQAPKMGRTCWLSPTYYAGLVKSMNGAEFPGQTNEKAEGIAIRTAGFNAYESNLCDDNGINLGGAAFHRSTFLMAARGVDSEGAASAGVEVQNVVVPGLGIPIQFRRWYDPDNGLLKCSVGLLYGVATGNDMIVRISSS